jgi:hypothetical protein
VSAPRARAAPALRAFALGLAVASPAAAVAAHHPEERAGARSPRPYDAPLLDAARVVVPERPLEYHTGDYAGITLAYHPSTGEHVRALVTRIAGIRAELANCLGREVLTKFELRVAAAPSEMARLAPMEQIPSNAAAVAFSQASLVVMSAASPVSSAPPDIEVLLRHELAHLALDEALGGQPAPRWLHEGFAVHFSGEDAAARAAILTVASLECELAPLDDLDALFPAEEAPRGVAYAEAPALARFLAAPPNHERFVDMLARLRSGEACGAAPSCSGAFEAAASAAYGEGLGDLDLRFRKDVARRYSFVPVFTAATLLWVLVAAAVLLRRAWARRALLAAARLAAEASRGPAGAGQSGRPRARSDAMIRSRVGAAPLPAGAVHAQGGAGSTAVHARRARARLADDEIALAADGADTRIDPDVPKVEHDGRWYTLH